MNELNNSRTITILGLAVIVLALAAVFLVNRPRAESPLKVPTTKQEVSLTPVTINQAAKTLLYLPLYIAQDRGFFKDEGIKATVVTGGGDSQAFAAVVGGSAQLGQGDPMMVPISRQRGGPGKIIGIIVDRVAFWGVAVNPKIPTINDPKDFRNQRVVTYPEPMTIYALQKRNVVLGGLTLGKTTSIIQAQFGTELGPLFARRADITMTIEPVVSQAIARGARIVYSFPEKYGEFALTGVMVTDDLLREQPDLVQRVMNAYQRALTYAHQNPNETIAVAVKEFPDVDKNIIKSAVKRMLEEETLPKTVTVSREAYEKAATVRRDIGDLEKDIPYNEAVENRFAEKAVQLYGPKL